MTLLRDYRDHCPAVDDPQPSAACEPAGATARVPLPLPEPLAVDGRLAPAGDHSKRQRAGCGLLREDDEALRLAYLRAAAIAGRHHGLQQAEVIAAHGWVAKRARRIAIYLCSIVCGWGVKPIERVAGVARGTGVYAVRAVEDMRDAANVDQLISRMEREMLG